MTLLPSTKNNKGELLYDSRELAFPPEAQTSSSNQNSLVQILCHKKKSSKIVMSQHFILLRPSRRQVYLVGLSLGATNLFTTTRHHQRPQVLLCESPSSSSSSSNLSRPPRRISQHRRGGGREGKAISWKEISSGSILGQFWFHVSLSLEGRSAGKEETKQ